MDIQPIKNEENYDNALTEIEAIWELKKERKEVINWIYS